MIRMLLKQMLRGIFRDKFHSFINVFGLGLGIACCIIGLLFIQDEWSADRRHANVARLHRYGVQMTIGGVTSVQTTCNAAAGPLLKEFIPGIESYIRVGPAGEILVKHKTDVFQEENFLWRRYFGMMFFPLPSVLRHVIRSYNQIFIWSLR